jgi:hypothetical protein
MHLILSMRGVICLRFVFKFVLATPNVVSFLYYLLNLKWRSTKRPRLLRSEVNATFIKPEGIPARDLSSYVQQLTFPVTYPIRAFLPVYHQQQAYLHRNSASTENSVNSPVISYSVGVKDNVFSEGNSSDIIILRCIVHYVVHNPASCHQRNQCLQTRRFRSSVIEKFYRKKVL